MAGEHDQVWERLHEHDSRIREVELNTRLNTRDLEELKAGHARLENTISRNHGSMTTSIESLSGRVQNVLDAKHFNEGKQEQKKVTNVDFKWAIGILITVAGLIFAWYQAAT